MNTFQRIAATIGIVIACTLMVLTMLLCVARSAKVQTAALSVVAEQLSRGLGTTVEVEHINYQFPNKLLVKGVLLEDLQHDTLLYADTLTAHADMWKLLAEDTLLIHEVRLSTARVNLYQTADSVPNYQFLVDAFRTEKKGANNPTSLNLRIDQIQLERITARYNEWNAQIDAARMHIYDISRGSINAEIEQFNGQLTNSKTNARKIRPLEVQGLEAHIVATDSLFSLPKLRVQLPNTKVQATELYIDHGNISVQFPEATITPADLATVLPSLYAMKAPWSFSAAINGTIDSLDAHHLHLKYRKNDVLCGDVTVLHIPTLVQSLASLSTLDPALRDSSLNSEFFLRARCEDLSMNKATLQDILSGIYGRPVTLPAMLSSLGQVHYKGALEGKISDLTLRGAFSSALGSVRTDGWASVPTDFKSIHYRGTISTKRFNLGKLLNQKDLGAIGFSVQTDGMVAEDTPFRGTAEAHIDHLVYKAYTYQDVFVKGAFQHSIFDGTCSSDDPNLNFRFDGKMRRHDNAAPTYQFALDLKHLRLGELNLSERYADSDLQLALNVDLQGATLDSMAGAVSLRNLSFARPTLQDTLVMDEFDLTLSTQENYRAIRIISPFVTASMAGEFSLSDLAQSFEKIAANTLPSIFPVKTLQRLKTTQTNNNFECNIYGKNLERISEVLELPIVIPDKPTIKANLSDQNGTAYLGIVVPELYLSGKHFESIALSVDASNAKQAKKANIKTSLFGMMHHTNTPTGRHVGDLQLYLHATATNDAACLRTNWSNVDDVHNAGEFHIETAFSRYADRPLITADIQPSDVIIADSVWKITPTHLTYSAADTALSIDHFRFGSTSQSIYATGIASTHSDDSIHVELQSVDLDYILGAFTNVKNSITFGGNVTGWATAYGIFKAPMFEASVSMQDASINQSLLGDVYATATLDSLNHVVIKGDAFDSRLAADTIVGNKKTHHVCHVDGLVGGANGAWRLNIYPDSVELGFVNYWTNSFLSDISGRASGEVTVWGGRDPQTKRPGTWVTVKAKAHNAGLTIPFTGARYYVQDSIFLDSAAVRIPTMEAHDAEGNPVIVSGLVTHNGTWEKLNYRIETEARKALVLDLPTTGEELYSGHVYANANAYIIGDAKDCRVIASGRTTGGNFVFSVAGASSATSSSFIEFVDHTPTLYPFFTEKPAAPITAKAPGKFDLSLMVEVTPEVTCEVLLDRRTGDCIRGKGDGNVRLHYSNSDLSMLGGVTLQQGTFGFTFQNVIRREFQIDEGSSVTWNGDAENPELNIRALYKVTASLKDLLGTEASSITTRSSVPVHCILNVTEHLNNPLIHFGIELPSSDESVLSEVRSVINTEEMLTRQVLYLLVFSRFYTPEYIQQTSNVGVNETYSLISSTVTGQINSWLSRLTDIVSVGFNFRTDGEGADASQEYEAQFEIHPVRGLLINGNFGYRYNDIANQPVFGNLDVEYMLTDNGKLRIKGYTHTVDKYSLRQANTIQGVGFVFKHDFNWPERKKKK